MERARQYARWSNQDNIGIIYIITDDMRLQLLNRSTNPELPRVSIIIINHNGCRWFELFMQGLVNTNYPNFEIIVVDNASSDQSLQYLRTKFESVRIVQLDRNRGFAEGANAGANAATGEVFAFINNDMEVTSKWLTHAVTKLLSDPRAAAVQCKILKYHSRDRIDCIGLSVNRYNLVHMIGRHEIDRGQYDELQEIGAASGGATVIWKKIFHDIGDYDPTYFMYYEDVDLSWRVRMKGFKILPAQSSIVYHVGSATAQILDSSDETRLTPFFGFHTAKNFLYCWLKNSSLQILLVYWPVMFFILSVKISFEIWKGKAPVARSQLKGVLWNIAHLRLIINQRKETKKLSKAGLRVIDLAINPYGSGYMKNWIRYGLRKARQNSGR